MKTKMMKHLTTLLTLLTFFGTSIHAQESPSCQVESCTDDDCCDAYCESGYATYLSAAIPIAALAVAAVIIATTDSRNHTSYSSSKSCSSGQHAHGHFR